MVFSFRGGDLYHSIREKCLDAVSKVLSQGYVPPLENIHLEVGDDRCIFSSLSGRVGTEVFPKIVELAAITRVGLDVYGSAGQDFHAVGSLQKDMEAPDELSFREACNKTIHAKNWLIELERSETHPLEGEWKRLGLRSNSEIFSTRFLPKREEREQYPAPVLVTLGTDLSGSEWLAKTRLFEYLNVVLNYWRELAGQDSSESEIPDRLSEYMKEKKLAEAQKILEKRK